MASQMDIEAALTEAFVAQGHDPTDTAFPNGPSLSTTALNYTLDFLYADGQAAALGLNAADRHLGLFQVTIRGPVQTATGDAAGMYANRTAASAVSLAFKRGTVFPYPVLTPAVYVHTQTPTITHLGKVTPEWYTTVVRIPFWADIYSA